MRCLGLIAALLVLLVSAPAWAQERSEADLPIARPAPWHQLPSGGRIVNEQSVADAAKSAPDAGEVESFFLFPAEPSSGWIIQVFPDGSVNAQFGSALGEAANLPKGSVHFAALLKAAYRLKSDKRLEGASQISVMLKDEPNAAFSLTNDALFRYLIDSFDDKWEPDIGIARFDKFLRQHPIYIDEMPAKRNGHE